MASPLQVSSPHDASEREAAAIARHVVHGGSAGPVAAHLAARSVDPRQGLRAVGATDSMREHPSGGVELATAIQRETSGGEALPVAVRRFMEPRLGADLGRVTIHTDARAAGLSERLHARAFTVGEHVFFGRGQYRPESTAGRELIAHELVHTVQQGASAPLGGARGGRVQRDAEDGSRSWWSKLVDFGEAAGKALVGELAPGLLPVLEGGAEGFLTWLEQRATAAAKGLFDKLMTPVHAIAGVGQQLGASFAPLAAAIQTAAGQIARNDCSPLREAAAKIEQVGLRLITPIVERIQPVVVAVKGFFDAVWSKVGAPIWDWIKEVAAAEWEKIKVIAGHVQRVARWIWRQTSGARQLVDQAWTWFKNKLGIGETPEGQDGLLQWVQRKFDTAWTAVKNKLAPFSSQLTTIGAAVAGVALALSPAGPVLAVGAAVAGAVQGLRWIRASWGQGNLIVQARTYIEHSLIPSLLAAVGRLGAAVSRMAGALGAALGNVADGLTRVVGLLAPSLLEFATAAVRWIADQATALAVWAQQRLASLASWINGALDSLKSFLAQMRDFFAKLARVVADVWALPFFLAERVWGWVPACIRDPIVDFIGPIILRQIEIFQELARDPEAWQRTKADVAQILRLVFRDRDLMGAVRKTFFLILRVFNLPPDLVATVAQKALAAWDVVVKKPLAFIKNTVRAVANGFQRLKSNIWGHVEYGLQGWLLGPLAEKNIRPPASWTDPRAVFGFVLDVAGLSVDHVFELMKLRFDPAKVERIRRLYGHVRSALAWINEVIDTSRSPAENASGIIERAKDFGKTLLTGLVEMVVTRVATELAVLAAAAAASAGLSEVVDVARRIYKALLSAVRWARRILDMVNDTLDNVAAIASGAIEVVGAKFEQILHRGMPVVIGFLADQVNLGSIPAKLQALVGPLRTKVDAAILWLIDRVKSFLDAAIGAARSVVESVRSWWQERRSFQGVDGATHSLHFRGGEQAAQLIVESDPMELAAYLRRVMNDAEASATVKADAADALQFYQQTIQPVQTHRTRAEAVTQFAHDFSMLSQKLVNIVGAGGGELPATADWLGEAPARSNVEKLSTRTSGGGTRPTGTMKGWAELQAAGLTGQPPYWLQMHMITAGVGGTGGQINVVPAPLSVNSSGEVRGFEVRLESLVKQKTPTGKQNVIWVAVRATSFHPANTEPSRGLICDGGTFVASLEFRAGRHFQDRSRIWVKDPTPVLSATASIPFPQGGPPDVNSAGATQLSRAADISLYFASAIVAEAKSGRGPFSGPAALEERMKAARSDMRATPEFRTMIENVRAAHSSNRIRFHTPNHL